jgi:hypothetical protein
MLVLIHILYPDQVHQKYHQELWIKLFRIIKQLGSVRFLTLFHRQRSLFDRWKTYFMRFQVLTASIITLMMEAVWTSETLVYLNETTQHYISVGCHRMQEVPVLSFGEKDPRFKVQTR